MRFHDHQVLVAYIFAQLAGRPCTLTMSQYSNCFVSQYSLLLLQHSKTAQTTLYVILYRSYHNVQYYSCCTAGSHLLVPCMQVQLSVGTPFSNRNSFLFFYFEDCTEYCTERNRWVKPEIPLNIQPINSCIEHTTPKDLLVE